MKGKIGKKAAAIALAFVMMFALAACKVTEHRHYHREHGDHDNNEQYKKYDRIDHSALDLVLGFAVLCIVLGYTVHYNVKVTGSFTCADHADKQ